VLDLVCSRGPSETKVFIPALIRTGKVGKYVSTVEDVASTARIDDTMGCDWKCAERANGPGLTVLEKPAFSERDASNTIAASLQIGQHLGRCEHHLLAESFSDNRHIDEGEQIVSV
jgi:hypothetical protein